jgi:hypothetical protein
MARNSDDVWELIFSKLPIIEHVNKNHYFDITAIQIKKLSGGGEARLLTKFDFREQMPSVMKNEGVAILAINNGNYRIARFNPFIDLEPIPSVKPVSISFPDNIITLNPKKLTNESATLDAALLSGIMSQTFGETVALTIRGRTRSPNFTFSLNDVAFPISGVQIEVDGGYEGDTTVNLVEAKIGSRSNINVRQLIYPQLVWEQYIGKQKTVRSFICFYQEPILRFIPISYENGICKAEHTKEKAFILEPEAKLNLYSIKVKADGKFPVLGVPFPQANRFETVLAMFSVVANGVEITKEELAQGFDINPEPRHVDYYFNAMRWIGLVEIENGIIRLTDEGQRITTMAHAARIKRLAEIIFSEPIFNYVLHHRASEVSDDLFERWNIGKSTKDRRLDTVRAWIGYFETFSNQENLFV